MSPLRLNGSTSGNVTLDAPAVSGNHTIVLPTGAGSAYQVVRNGATAGSLEFTDKIVSGTAVASTSGTSIDFTGIPSWVKRVTVMMNGVSTNGTSVVQVQLGAGSVTTTGYLGAASVGANGVAQAVTQPTTGFSICADGAASYVRHGAVQLLNVSSNVWTSSGAGGESAAGRFWTTGGTISLSGTLDRVRITTVNGTDTFDAGSINILYE